MITFNLSLAGNQYQLTNRAIGLPTQLGKSTWVQGEANPYYQETLVARHVLRNIDSQRTPEQAEAIKSFL